MIVITNSIAVRDLLFKIHHVYFVSDTDIVEDWYDIDQFDVIVIDIDSARGLSSPLLIRNNNKTIPIIGISESWDAPRRVTFLQNGGLYLLQKPFDAREMLAVVHMVNNRVGQEVKIKLHNDRLIIRTGDMMVTFDGKPVKFTPSQVKILIELAKNCGRTVRKETLLKALYSPEDEAPESKIVDVLVSKIRGKLNKFDPELGKCITTVWGIGYSLIDSPEN